MTESYTVIVRKEHCQYREGYYYIDITREKAREDYRIKDQARIWFKNVLGLAIIKGRLLAIPVINIDK